MCPAAAGALLLCGRRAGACVRLPHPNARHEQGDPVHAPQRKKSRRLSTYTLWRLSGDNALQHRTFPRPPHPFSLAGEVDLPANWRSIADALPCPAIKTPKSFTTWPQRHPMLVDMRLRPKASAAAACASRGCLWGLTFSRCYARRRLSRWRLTASTCRAPCGRSALSPQKARRSSTLQWCRSARATRTGTASS